MNIRTFESPLLSIQYRQKLRYEADLVHNIIKKYKYNKNKKFKKLLETTIYKKLLAIKHAFPWFVYHETGEVGRPNAYRLITLEMWCRVAPAAVKPSVCHRPVNTISALEYV